MTTKQLSEILNQLPTWAIPSKDGATLSSYPTKGPVSDISWTDGSYVSCIENDEVEQILTGWLFTELMKRSMWVVPTFGGKKYIVDCFHGSIASGTTPLKAMINAALKIGETNG